MKALIVYGTRYGTAAEIAAEMVKVLEQENVDVDLVNANNIKEYDISPYNLVVVGSGIKIGRWTKNSLNFLKNNKDVLSKKKGSIVCNLWSCK